MAASKFVRVLARRANAIWATTVWSVGRQSGEEARSFLDMATVMCDRQGVWILPAAGHGSDSVVMWQSFTRYFFELPED